MPKMSTHVSSFSKKLTTKLLVKRFGECCGSTVVANTFYWLSSHCNLAWRFVSVAAAVTRQSVTVSVGLRQSVCFHHSSSQSM